MKKYIAVILFFGLAVKAICFLSDTSTRFSCTWHLEKYKAALRVVLEHKDLLVKNNKLPKDPEWEAQIITRFSVEKLHKDNPQYQAILYLWDHKLISDDYGITFSDFWHSIDFDLPGEGRFLCYLPSNKFDFPCASGQIMVHQKLEEDWYYVHYCPL